MQMVRLSEGIASEKAASQVCVAYRCVGLDACAEYIWLYTLHVHSATCTSHSMSESSFWHA